MKRIHASELEGGDDHEFLVRLYTHVLDRWPDRDGYSHYLARIDGKAEARVSVIRDVARSEEARKLDIEVIFDQGETPVEAAPPPAAPAPPALPASIALPASLAGAGRPAAPFGMLGFPGAPGTPIPGPGHPAPPPMPPIPSAAPFAAISAEVAALRAQVLRLEAEIATLREARAAAPADAAQRTIEAPPSGTLLEDVAQQIDALFALGLAAIEARVVALERGQHGA